MTNEGVSVSRNGWRAHDDNTEAPNRDGVDTEDCAHLRAPHGESDSEDAEEWSL